jgi:hypothetical protein
VARKRRVASILFVLIVFVAAVLIFRDEAFIGMLPPPDMSPPPPDYIGPK